MLLVVGDEVVQSEAIVARDEIDARLYLAPFMAVHFGTAEQPVGHLSDRALFTAEETAEVVAETAVPFLPGITDEATDLVQTRRVPRFRDELRASQRRVGFEIPQHGRIRHRRPARVARQN